MDHFLCNNPQLKTRRRTLRNNATENEALLWGVLRKRGLGAKFVRQYSVGNYVLDFYCPRKKLAIEVDGSQHAEEKEQIHDKKRTFFMEEYGIKVLRFWNNEITNALPAVCDEIVFHLENQK